MKTRAAGTKFTERDAEARRRQEAERSSGSAWGLANPGGAGPSWAPREGVATGGAPRPAPGAGPDARLLYPAGRAGGNVGVGDGGSDSDSDESDGEDDVGWAAPRQPRKRGGQKDQREARARAREMLDSASPEALESAASEWRRQRREREAFLGGRTAAPGSLPHASNALSAGEAEERVNAQLVRFSSAAQLLRFCEQSGGLFTPRNTSTALFKLAKLGLRLRRDGTAQVPPVGPRVGRADDPGAAAGDLLRRAVRQAGAMGASQAAVSAYALSLMGAGPATRAPEGRPVAEGSAVLPWEAGEAAAGPGRGQGPDGGAGAGPPRAATVDSLRGGLLDRLEVLLRRSPRVEQSQMLRQIGARWPDVAADVRARDALREVPAYPRPGDYAGPGAAGGRERGARGAGGRAGGAGRGEMWRGPQSERAPGGSGAGADAGAEAGAGAVEWDPRALGMAVTAAAGLVARGDRPVLRALLAAEACGRIHEGALDIRTLSTVIAHSTALGWGGLRPVAAALALGADDKMGDAGFRQMSVLARHAPLLAAASGREGARALPQRLATRLLASPMERAPPSHLTRALWALAGRRGALRAGPPESRALADMLVERASRALGGGDGGEGAGPPGPGARAALGPSEAAMCVDLAAAYLARGGSGPAARADVAALGAASAGDLLSADLEALGPGCVRPLRAGRLLQALGALGEGGGGVGGVGAQGPGAGGEAPRRSLEALARWAAAERS